MEKEANKAVQAVQVKTVFSLTGFIYSLGLGLVFIYLFLWKEIGVSHVIFSVLAAGGMFIPVWRDEKIHINKYRDGRIAFLSVLLLSLVFVFRLNPYIVVFAFLTLPVLYGVALLKIFYREETSRLTVYDFVLLPLSLLASAVIDFFSMFVLTLKEMHRSKGYRDVGFRVLRGLVIAIPFLILFVGLLSSADLVFKEFFEDLARAIFGDSIGENMVKLIVGAIVATYMTTLNYALWNKSSILSKSINYREHLRIKSLTPNWDLLSVNVFLTLLNLLFLTFVFVQFFYLFGGSDNVIGEKATFTYAEYARKGFWELLYVSVVVYFIATVLNLKAGGVSKNLNMFFKVNYFVMIFSMFVVIFSAHNRLSLYESVYGFTNLRLLVHFAIGIIFTMFLLLLVSYFRANRLHFIESSTAILMVFVYFVLMIVPSDYVVAKLNYERYKDTGKIDLAYIFNRSDEVIPVLIEMAQETENINVKALTFDELKDRQKKLAKRSDRWQSFNFASQKYEKDIKDALAGEKIWLLEMDEIFEKELDSYIELMEMDKYDDAFKNHWSASTNKSDLSQLSGVDIVNYSLQGITKYRVEDTNDEILRSASFKVNYLFVDGKGVVKKSVDENLIFKLENGDWKISEANWFTIGSKMTGYGYSSDNLRMIKENYYYPSDTETFEEPW